MTLIDQFIARVERLERRFNGDKHNQDFWMMNVDELKAVRDFLTKPGLFDEARETEK